MIIPSAVEEDAARDVRFSAAFALSGRHASLERPSRRLSSDPPGFGVKEVDRLGADPWWHTGPLPGCLFRPTTDIDVSDTELARAKRL
jgi:hypothetical protein